MPNTRKTEDAEAPLLFPIDYADVAHVRRTVSLRAADELVVAHHYLCRRGARKFWRCSIERCDLEQIAAVGLIKASRRYDAASDTPFEAYAWILIVGELMHYVRDYERPVRVPRRLQALERDFDRMRDSLVGDLGREPSDVELARELRIPLATLAELRRANNAALPAELEDGDTYAPGGADLLSFEDRLA